MNDSNQITVKPDKDSLVDLLKDIQNGTIRIPKFQRPLVWKDNQMKQLFDSISKEYPVGSFLFWQPKQKFECFSYFGPYEIENKEVNENTIYVLDGCQRLTTLFGVLSNPNKFKFWKNYDSNNDSRYSIYFDLKDADFINRRVKTNSPRYIPLYKAFDTYEYLDFFKKIQDEVKNKNEQIKYIENLKKISKTLTDYEIPFTIIKGGDINEAVDIFTRVNTMGTDIKKDGMISALTYNKDSHFLLSENIDKLLLEMKMYNFDKMKRDTILNCIACAIDNKKVYFDVNIKEAAKNKQLFEETTDEVIVNIKKAIKFLYYELNIIHYDLLPYPNQLIFITEFFRLSPNEKELYKLKDWFWITSYSNYFTIYKLSEQREAFKVFRDFAVGLHDNGIYLSDENSLFSDSIAQHFVVQEFPDEIDFSSVRSKTLQLFILNHIKRGSEIVNNEYESIIEQFIFSNEGRKVGNVILRFISEYEKSGERKDLNKFINDEMIIWDSYFINQEIVNLYNENDEDLIVQREQLIKKAENRFIKKLKFLKNPSLIT